MRKPAQKSGLFVLYFSKYDDIIVKKGGIFMKRSFVILVAVVLVAGFMLYGCGPQKADSSRSAIDTAKTMQTTQEKVDYLVGQAKAFYNSKEFQGAVDIAQYILRYLDKDSPAAKELLTKAQEALAAQAKSAAEQAKKEFGL
jgi:hypothetical protein